VRLRNAILVAACAIGGCGDDNDPKTGLENGHLGDTCQVAEDCVALRYDLAPETNARDTVECASMAGPKRCRFSCNLNGKENPDAVEACLALGGTCTNDVCLAQ
jgi:hypothetical protein